MRLFGPPARVGFPSGPRTALLPGCTTGVGLVAGERRRPAADRADLCARTPPARATRPARRSGRVRTNGQWQNASRQRSCYGRNHSKTGKQGEVRISLFPACAAIFSPARAHFSARCRRKLVRLFTERSTERTLNTSSPIRGSISRMVASGSRCKRNARLGRLGDDPAGDVMGVAEWNFQGPHQPVGKIGRGRIALACRLLHARAYRARDRRPCRSSPRPTVRARQRHPSMPSLSSCMSLA